MTDQEKKPQPTAKPAAKTAEPAKKAPARKKAVTKKAGTAAAKKTPEKVTTTKTAASAKKVRARSATTGAEKAPRRSARSSARGDTVSAEQRHRMIEETAYLMAQARDFAPGGELEDWLNAEAEIDARLTSSQAKA